MMRKKVREFLGYICLWIKNHRIDSLLLFASALVVIGILVSFTVSLGTNLIILLGTIGLGLGFYLKVNRSPNQKLSDYGHFMLGLAALITLPQTPEMLKHILRIEQSIDALNAIKQDHDGKAKNQTLPDLMKSSDKADMKTRINALIRSENAMPAECSQEPWNGTVSVENRAPIPGTAYLPEARAKKIIQSLDGNPSFDKNAITAMVQENLEVWHPKTYPPKCRGYKVE